MTDPPRAGVTDEAVASFADAPDPRTREVLQSLVRHLHGFAREVGLTEAESVALEYLKAFDNGGVTTNGGSILDLFADDAASGS